MDEENRESWGGARKGAGRPKKAKGEALTTSIEVPCTEADKVRWQKKAAKDEKPVGAWARERLNAAR